MIPHRKTLRKNFSMLQATWNLLMDREREYLTWEDYQEQMTILELHTWQQVTRKQSLRNALAPTAL